MERDIITTMLCSEETYDLGMDLMWESGADYDEVIKAVHVYYRESGVRPSRHREKIEIDYIRWAGAIHPEGVAANAHKIYALQNLGLGQ